MFLKMPEGISLNGDEILTTYFSPNDNSSMILVLGENMNNEKDGCSFVYLYQCIDGEVDHGIDAFVFSSGEKARKFVNSIPEMRALDFMLEGLGVTPQIC
ncbi:hypothetical protein [Sporosarcina sp. P7]|uniref:hypothetical protein n=1 Tax=Sporosarcina sp. P7 TaxID=2048244 RepID=UPI000C1630C1|nr:hypothetical protein [Sporosarcina sp. P7]PID23472.1 hypothetical protein CSV60_14495 [Sporosarcina sp. P7]